MTIHSALQRTYNPTQEYRGFDAAAWVMTANSVHVMKESGHGALPNTEVEFMADGVTPIMWSAQQGGQVSFLAVGVWEVLLEGNRGGGKTDVLTMDFLSSVGKGYGRFWRGLLLRRTYPELADVIEKSMQWFPKVYPGATYNQQKHEWTFPTGETLRFGYANKPKDYYAYHGHAYPWIAWEELSTWPDDKLYRKFFSVNRSSVVGMPRRYLSTTNPIGVGHSWIKDRWRLPAMKGRIITDAKNDDGSLAPPRIAIHCDLFDNKVLLRAEKDYVQKLRASADDEATAAGWVEGSWNIVAGGMFSDVWNASVHVLPDFIPPKGWRVDKSYDDGSSAPFSVGWWTQSNGEDLLLPGGRTMPTIRGDLFRIREWYGWKEGKRNAGLNLPPHEITAGIIERELKWGLHGRALAGPADSSIFSNEHGFCLADDFRKSVFVNGRSYNGIAWQRSDKAPGSRVAGWRQIRTLLKGALDRPRRKPGLFICAGCVQWINIVPILPRDPDKLDDVEYPEDHLGDETRYRVHNPPRVMSVGRRAGT